MQGCLGMEEMIRRQLALKHPIYRTWKVAGWRCVFGPYLTHNDIWTTPSPEGGASF
jgi:hypothetical protein